MDTTLVNSLKQRFDYDSWRGINTLQRNLFIWRFALTTYTLQGWKLVRAKKVELLGMPTQLQTLWQRIEKGENTLLRLDVFECSSRVTAHDCLVQLLANTQSPLVERASYVRIGDIAFSGGSDPWLAYARANLVVFLRNAGVTVTQVIEPALSLDKDLSTEVAADVKAEPAREIRRFGLGTKTIRMGRTAPLDVEVEEPQDTPRWYKIFSDGEVSVEKGRLVYKASAVKNQYLTLVALAANRIAARRMLHLNVRK